MKSKIKLNCVFLIAFLFITFTNHSQIAVDSSGGNNIASTGSVSYSVGQIVYIMNESATGSVFQGVQLPYEIMTLSANEIKEINVVFKAYPNPTVGNVFLKIENYNIENLRFELTDGSGRIIDHQIVNSQETKIEMDNLSHGVYIISVFDKNKIIKSFKILKK